jgi:hypothetical protein
MTTSTDAEPALYRENPTLQNSNRSNPGSSRSDARTIGAAFASISKQAGVRQWPQR